MFYLIIYLFINFFNVDYKTLAAYALITILQNSSKLPTNLAPRTDQSLTSVHFSQDDILKIIQNLNPNKAHGPDKISIRMIKICGKSLCKPLEMIFKPCIIKGEYPSEWKKANVVPVHKKATSNC